MIRDVDALWDDQWGRLEEFVPGGRKGKRGPRADNRRCLNALLWMARQTGAGATCQSRLASTQR
jgi:transposase